MTTIWKIRELQPTTSKTPMRQVPLGLSKPLASIQTNLIRTWRAHVKIKDKDIHLGTFKCPLLARLAFEDAYKDEHGFYPRMKPTQSTSDLTLACSFNSSAVSPRRACGWARVYAKEHWEAFVSL